MDTPQSPPRTSGAGVTNELAVGLPPLSVGRKATWDYYRIEFLADGYPGRRSDAGLHPHPIYGPYVITDYLAQYRRSGDPVFHDAAARVADAATARMEEHQDSLVFYYHPNTGLSSLPDRFYSGLTQARYLGALGKLEAQLPGRRYAEASAAILRSLQVPAEDGGVARRTPGGGLLIEEYSHAVPDYTLNGWTTATTLVHEFAEATGDEQARAIFHDSVRGIRDVLPLYDVPELANSRYRLTGPARVRLRTTRPGARILDGAVEVPGQGTYGLEARGGKWSSGFVSGVTDGRIVGQEAVMEVLLCRATWPAANALALELLVDEPGELTVEIGTGPYDPLASRLVAGDYERVATVSLTEGRNTVRVPVPWAQAELVAYPTNFAKRIGGRQYNSYHFIHVDTLAKLVEATGDELLAYYRTRWEAYPRRWPEMPVYSEADIVLERYRAQAR